MGRPFKAAPYNPNNKAQPSQDEQPSVTSDIGVRFQQGDCSPSSVGFGEHEAFRHAGDVCVVNSVLGHAEPSVSFVLRRTVLTMF